MSEFADHYDRAAPVYETLGEIDGWFCPGNRDFTGWYREKAARGEWDGKARPFALGREFDTIREDLDRVVYATVNYAPADWFADAWDRYSWDENVREWEGGESPTPGYGELMAYAPFADIDLADHIKGQRPAGDIDQLAIERALRLYLQAFAELAGDRQHVFALDSVGGAYLMLAPTSTTPLAEAFEPDARAVLFADLMDRLNTWLGDVRDRVNEAVPAVVDVFEPDLLNNKNRLYKAPLSVHSSLDGVVTPMETDRPEYTYTPLEAVDCDFVSETVEWADGFTADHREAVDSLMRTLYPDHYAAAGGWRPAAEARIEELREEQRRNRDRRQRQLTADDIPDDLDTTDDIDVLNAALEAIDVRDVARRVADAYDTAPGRDPPRFDPPWRASSTGTSCFVDRDKWFDLDGGDGGGALRLAARASGIIGEGESLRGQDYWDAVSQLRGLGFEVPYFTGGDGLHPDALRLNEPDDTLEDQRGRAIRQALAEEIRQ